MPQMQFRNDTPFQTFLYESLDEEDRPIAVLVVRATYAVRGHALVLAPDQQEVGKRDEYFGEAGQSSVRVDTDLVPKKYHADITLDASAHAPGGVPARAWEVAVTVGEKSKRLRVTGPRHWERTGGRWKLTDPSPTSKVPVRYELAYGGRYRSGEETFECEQNPVGRGFVNPKAIERDAVVPAPQIESPGDPIRDFGRAYEVAGFGPVAKAWLPRRTLCGTADAEWQRTRWPLRPKDFDFHYYNCAPPGLRYDGFLRGDEPVRLEGLSPGGEIRFRLPGVRLLCMTLAGDRKPHLFRPDLDTVHLAVAEERVNLCWRAAVPNCDPLNLIQVLVDTPLRG